ncbi:hypothetical protein SELMODRAFT_431629 [Selaginella moellendorffii]|uniref:SHSP domain-containing protein n=1 Tax=Selaginella moellendorffii TaxID=88036 RepID=D8TD98_SELML|nr:hypothetical protein SELMODRAFT_431629 [Selaginella moellendorffii]
MPGGLPQFPDHDGLVALYNFEKKHAYQLLLNCLKHVDKGYDERKLLWSSFENQQFYTVDVQVPGLSSLDQVHVEKHGRGVLVSTEMDVYRPEKLAVPPYTNVDGLIANLQDEILTIRLPKGAAALEGTTSTVPIEDRDEAELDTRIFHEQTSQGRMTSITTFFVSKFQACRKRLVARGSDCATERLPAKEV